MSSPWPVINNKGSVPFNFERAERIVALYDKAKSEGAGAVAFEGKMIDEPVVRRAQRTLARSRRIESKPSA
jgi:citrate lyase subunit beta/citryl-CoA lyase